MRPTLYLLSTLFSLACIGFCMPGLVQAQVIINEVMADPTAASDKSEWIELYNYSDQDVDLNGWSLDGKPISATSPVMISEGGFYIVTKTIADYKAEFGNTSNLIELAISLTNSGKTLELTDGQGYKDTLTYTAVSPNISWERKGSICSDLVKHPTAHSVNALNVAYSMGCPGNEPPPTSDLPRVQISEVFPSPEADKQEDEWIELYNMGDKAIDLTGWTIADKSSSSKLDGLVISPHQYLVLSELSISLNNGGDELSLLDAEKKIVDAMTYGDVEKSFAAMRVWVSDKYSNDLQVTARPTSALRNIYQAEHEVITVTEKVEVQVPVYVEKIEYIEKVSEPSVLGQSYTLPSTEVHLLSEAPPEESRFTLQTWPVFLIILIISLGYLLTDRRMWGELQSGRVKLVGRLDSLSHRFPMLDQWKSRLRAYALDRST
jgi:hypothetical protein